MDKEIKKLIIINTIRDIQLSLLKEKQKGLIINEDIVNDILFNIENAEIGDRADEEYQKEKDEDAMEDSK
ncbi:TPA: hypothetical protein DIU22_04880 [Candidatus Woesebacteria bacterium]|nr:hypothetical protein [Candidatus Woesebacteria bacterium]